MQHLEKYLVIILSLIAINGPLMSQIVISESDVSPYTTENLIERVLLKGGVDILDVQYSGSAKAVGVFNHAQKYIGIKKGIVLSTGLSELAGTVNGPVYAGDKTSGSSVTDNDLQNLSPSTDIEDIAKYEIRFIPTSDKISFKYVFASEEYPEFVCATFNDVFGFFISGPNPNGGDYNNENIALVPNPSDPSGQTFTNFPVSINSINPGAAGDRGDPANCEDSPSASLGFSQFYNKTDNNTFPVYDGYTDVFFAVADVVPCQEYVIKLGIADSGDGDFDSAVFIEAKSFGTSSLLAEVITPGLDRLIAEDCGSAEVKFTLPKVTNVDVPVELRVLQDPSLESPAEYMVDYFGIQEDLVIASGTNSVSMTLDAIEDSLNEGIEYIYFDYKLDVCQRDTIRIAISDNQMPDITVLDERTVCEGTQITLSANFPSDFEPTPGQRFTQEEHIDIDADSTSYVSTLNVKGILPDLLAQNVISKVCIDTLWHTYLNSLDIYLETPGGQLIELSSSNGAREDNDLQIDTFANTCFSLNGNREIHLGDPVEGQLDLNNPTYTDNFIPEGEWSDIYINNTQPANGEYKLIVFNHAPSGIGRLESWSIVFTSSYSFNYQWYDNDDPIPCSQDCQTISQTPGDSSLYVLEVTDSYGCKLRDTTLINFNFVPLTPTTISCESISPSELRVCWEPVDNVAQYGVSYIGLADYYFVDGTVTCYNLNGLIPGTSYTIQVRAFNNECRSGNGNTSCTTDLCNGDDPIFEEIIVQEPSCFNGKDGSINISTVGGNDDLEFHLNTFENDIGDGLFEGLSSNQYLIRVIDESNCGIDTLLFLEEPTELSLSFDVTPVACRNESTGALTPIPFGDHPPFTFLWEDGSMDSINMNLGSGSYSVTVTDSKDCTARASYTLENPPEFYIDFFNIEDASCFNTSDGVIEVFAEGGILDYTYDWSHNPQLSSPRASGLSNGDYSVTVYDGNLCARTENFNVGSAPQIDIDIEFLFLDCSNTTGSTIRANPSNGAEPYMFEWSNGQTGQTITNVLEGNINLKVTDADGCEQEMLVNVSPAAAFGISAQQSNLSCPADNDGSIQLLIEGAIDDSYDYQWSHGETSSLANNLSLGDYCVTITDQDNCSLDTCFMIVSLELFEIQLVQLENVICNGDSNGQIEIQIEGVGAPFDTQWSNGFSGESILNLTAGQYEVMVTNSNDCVVAMTFDIEEPQPLSYTSQISDIFCVTDTSGSISIAGTGGTKPYDYQWSTGDQDSVANDLMIGEYYFTITDANQCSFVDTLEIKGPGQALVLGSEIKGASCDKVFNGSITALASGGSPPYTYSLNDQGFTSNNIFTGLQTGTYVLRVRDDNDCVLTIQEIVIESPNPLTVDLGKDTTVLSGTNLNLNPIITNGIGNLTYNWNLQGSDRLMCSDCSSNGIDSILNSAIVSLTVVDSEGCAAEDFITIYIGSSVEYSVEVPTGFSPNNDGRNDRLGIYGQEGVDIKLFRVYSRWGDMVFESSEIQINQDDLGWDGTYRNKELPTGVYHWVLEFEDDSGTTILKKGNTTLIK